MIAAVVLAAGSSSRMGTPKMALPWGESTVIGHVVGVLLQAGIDEPLVVTGGDRQQVEACLKDLPVRLVFNPRFAEGDMISSFQAGLASLPPSVDAALFVLGDQPQVQVKVVKALLRAYQESPALIVVPSYRMRRGHPWVIGRPLWDEIMRLEPPGTLRQVLQAHSSQIHYLVLETDTILRDLDTPSDYERERPA